MRKIFLILPIIFATGCVKNYRACVLSTTTGFNCTHLISKPTATGIAEYLSAFDEDSITFVLKKQDKRAKDAHTVDPTPEERNHKELPKAPATKERLPL